MSVVANDLQNKLCLGTVQFGSRYGINNAIGRKPNKQEVFDIVETALNLGINTFDTAAGYGNAEELLGEFRLCQRGAKIISKITSDFDDENKTLDEIKKSLARLQTDKIFGIMLHDAKDFYRQNILRGLKNAKEKGLIEKVGVSVYEPEDALNVVHDTDIDLIQIPYNVFDKRLDKTDFFDLVKKNNATVFARSTFLQGLLLTEHKTLHDDLKIAAPYIAEFHQVVRHFNFLPHEAAMLYAMCHRSIDYVVFGVDTKEQLMQNVAIIDGKNSFGDCYGDLQCRFYNIDKKIISPYMWRV